MEWEIKKTDYGVVLHHNGKHKGYDYPWVTLAIKYAQGEVYWQKYVEESREWGFRQEKPEKLICPCGKEIPEEIFFQFWLLD